ncbi:hypothetical protein SCG7086_BK_00020 [Chlamydiales bacterium SCGC AG-110-P3]|nr:hypothetical protein SCG7086_BK_00020 [Chlamydiales bacterium SCGC AG-110-P3]
MESSIHDPTSAKQWSQLISSNKPLVWDSTTKKGNFAGRNIIALESESPQSSPRVSNEDIIRITYQLRKNLPENSLESTKKFIQKANKNRDPGFLQRIAERFRNKFARGGVGRFCTVSQLANYLLCELDPSTDLIPTTKGGGGGLTNLGNTCYANAALQFIATKPNIQEDLRAQIAELSEKIDPLSYQTTPEAEKIKAQLTLTKNLLKLVNTIHSAKETHTYIGPTAMETFLISCVDSGWAETLLTPLETKILDQVAEQVSSLDTSSSSKDIDYIFDTIEEKMYQEVETKFEEEVTAYKALIQEKQQAVQKAVINDEKNDAQDSLKANIQNLKDKENGKDKTIGYSQTSIDNAIALMKQQIKIDCAGRPAKEIKGDILKACLFRTQLDSSEFMMWLLTLTLKDINTVNMTSTNKKNEKQALPTLSIRTTPSSLKGVRAILGANSPQKAPVNKEELIKKINSTDVIASSSNKALAIKYLNELTDLSSGCPIPDRLPEFTREEMILAAISATDDNATVSLDNLPTHFVQNINRFATFELGGDKDRTPVSIDENLSLTVGDETKHYRATGAVLHIGTNTNSGHYTALRREEDGSWNYYNDTARSIESDINQVAIGERVYLILWQEIEDQ